MNDESRTVLENDLAALADASHSDPFRVLGRHQHAEEETIRVYLPEATEVALDDPARVMRALKQPGFFEWQGPIGEVANDYHLLWTDFDGCEHRSRDPYRFSTEGYELDLHLFGEGRHRHAQRLLGAHLTIRDGVAGVDFGVWAPNAQRVSVVGDFNNWDGRGHPMVKAGEGGVWLLFVPDVAPGALYKFELRTRGAGQVLLKTDPCGRRFEMRPETAAVVEAEGDYAWRDQDWLAARRNFDLSRSPMSVYEVHLGSWQRAGDGGFLSYAQLAERLIPYVQEQGFTHIELLPITEHPLDASWGYQALGYFAPTSRHGSPDELRYFIDECHLRGIGVILDWVPGHFPRDWHGLARFDGTALYEHADPRRGEHQDWGTLIFNFGRNEVRSFLISSALFWIETFHIDGLRVDAVASMLYLDYSRNLGEWIPNAQGGNENIEALEFLRQLNDTVHAVQPGVITIAEDSTSWPQVTRPTSVGGLGFSAKWNLGWMHDSLDYMSQDPIHRKYHHDRLTFGLLYAHTENYVLPFSHDEVVHGKRSMLGKMPADRWQRFANLRLLYAYQFFYPGKKHLFMGAEIAASREWNEDEGLDWRQLDDPLHLGIQRVVSDLNGLYKTWTPLHRYDFDPTRGFTWIDCHDSMQSVVSFVRRADGEEDLVICLNFTPVVRENYRIGVALAGAYEEVFNSDSSYYGGSNVGNLGVLTAQDKAWMERPYSLELTLPPLGALLLRPIARTSVDKDSV